MRRRVALVAGVLVVVALASAAAVVVLRDRLAGPGAAVPFGARAIAVDPSASPAPPGPVTRAPDAGLLTRSDAVPLTAAGLDPDAQRVIDVTSLQLSLERYRVAWGGYPDALDRLFPDFAPVENGHALAAPPVDPATHRPYDYRLVTPTTYLITATMSGGRAWHGTRP